MHSSFLFFFLIFHCKCHTTEDFYAYDQGKTSGPKEYDVLITNPPYTAEHIPKLLEFCKSSGKPCMLLLPNYVLHKFSSVLDAFHSSELFYIWSKTRYKYKSPKFARTKDKARKDRVTSPFISFWYCYVPFAEGLLAKRQFETEYISSKKKAQKIVSTSLTLKEEEKTNTQKMAERLLKGNFASSSKMFPEFLLDRSSKKQSSKGSGSKRHTENRGGKHKKRQKKH